VRRTSQTTGYRRDSQRDPAIVTVKTSESEASSSIWRSAVDSSADRVGDRGATLVGAGGAVGTAGRYAQSLQTDNAVRDLPLEEDEALLDRDVRGIYETDRQLVELVASGIG